MNIEGKVEYPSYPTLLGCSLYYIFPSGGMPVLGPPTVIFTQKVGIKVKIHNEGSPDSTMKLTVALVEVFNKG